MQNIKERIKEICGELDADIYWKDCNFLNDDDNNEIPTFHNRDIGYTISFREVLLWYLPRLGQWDDEPNCYECDHKACSNYMHIENCKDMAIDKKVKEKHYSLFLELVDIYAYYTQQDHVRYNELKDKCKSLLNEIMK